MFFICCTWIFSRLSLKSRPFLSVFSPPPPPLLLNMTLSGLGCRICCISLSERRPWMAGGAGLPRTTPPPPPSHLFPLLPPGGQWCPWAAAGSPHARLLFSGLVLEFKLEPGEALPQKKSDMGNFIWEALEEMIPSFPLISQKREMS